MIAMRHDQFLLLLMTISTGLASCGGENDSSANRVATATPFSSLDAAYLQDTAAAGDEAVNEAPTTSGNAGNAIEGGQGDGTIEARAQLVACNDGTGEVNCCPGNPVAGAPCDFGINQCFTPCNKGVRGDFGCAGTWIQGSGLFSCNGGPDAGGD
jgi:hypothetical protein